MHLVSCACLSFIKNVLPQYTSFSGFNFKNLSTWFDVPLVRTHLTPQCQKQFLIFDFFSRAIGITQQQQQQLKWQYFSLPHCSSFENSVTREKSPNVHKSCPKTISLEKLKILAPTQKLSKTVEDLGKLIVAKGFEKLPKVQ